MHFKNGRLAFDGDPVVCFGYTGKVVAGKITNLTSGSNCNCDVVVPVVGGTDRMTCQDVGRMYHAEDAYKAAEMVNTPPASSPPVDLAKEGLPTKAEPPTASSGDTATS